MNKTTYNVGDFYEKKFLISEQIINDFAKVTGDNNPIHVNEEFAKNTFLKKRIAHGFLYGSFISKVLGTEFPGEGTIYVSQSLEFLKPVFIGDELTLLIEVVDILPKGKMKLKTTIINQNSLLILTGFAVIMKVEF